MMKEIKSDIKNLIENVLEENPAIIGINVGTPTGTYILSVYNKKYERLTENQIASATSSLIFLASKMLKGTLNQNLSYNLVTGKKYLLISIMNNEISMIAYLDRQLANLEALDGVVNSLKKLGLQISAIVETSDLVKQGLFVKLKRAIPNALLIAIITKEGLPIKIQSAMPEPTISAMISALFNISSLLTEDFEYSVSAGEAGSVIIHELDNNRVLCVAVPEADESKVGSYIVKIKTIISR
jgi:predicted regulator of Ras-like GTPase activity (Roadblock/LC7/MglB family)